MQHGHNKADPREEDGTAAAGREGSAEEGQHDVGSGAVARHALVHNKARDAVDGHQHGGLRQASCGEPRDGAKPDSGIQDAESAEPCRAAHWESRLGRAACADIGGRRERLACWHKNSRS